MWLNNNRISTIDIDAFDSLTSLQSLFPFCSCFSVQLHVLSLSYNSLSYIPPTLFDNNPSLRYVFVMSVKYQFILVSSETLVQITFLLCHQTSFLNSPLCILCFDDIFFHYSFDSLLTSFLLVFHLYRLVYSRILLSLITCNHLNMFYLTFWYFCL